MLQTLIWWQNAAAIVVVNCDANAETFKTIIFWPQLELRFRD
jgi:hypothetical protein